MAIIVATGTDWAYIAGLLDSGGHIGLSNSFSPRIHIAIYRTVQEGNPLPELCKVTGVGHVYPAETPAGRSGKAWEIHKQDDIELFLNRVTPYLKIKRSQAFLMLLFVQVHKEQRPSQERKELDEQIYNLIREYNRGSSDRVMGRELFFGSRDPLSDTPYFH